MTNVKCQINLGSRKNSTLDKFDYSELTYNFFYNEEFDPGSG